MKRNVLSFGLGIAALAPTVLLAQPAPHGTARQSADTRDAAGAVSRKCRGKVRLGCRPATNVSQAWQLPTLDVAPEPAPTETLAQDLQSAYETAPTLQAQRYQLRASDEDYALALSELRPTTALQVSGGYDKTVPGRTTQATRFGGSPIITSNTMAAQATLNQPIYTGGKAAADRDAAIAEVRAGREQLRGTEGDLLLQVITSYADVRRDAEALRLYGANLRQLEKTLDEVKARREAGELTRTDIAQAETQLQLARTQANTAREQLEQDRATFAAFVGHDPGNLAPPPQLPDIPVSVGEAFGIAEQQSPDLAQAIDTERESRARIAAAQAQGKPTFSLTGTATLTGQATPYYLRNEDQEFAGQAVLTIPITNGGRVGALVAQAEDHNAADRIGIEAARRQMVDTIVNAWNGMATSQRNIAVDIGEVNSAGVFDQGTFEEYRAGLRSTFDVLYAHATLLNARVALVAARHDLYVAEATLMRRIGRLEARSLMTGTGLYDPDGNVRHAERRGAVPWDGAVRAIDRVDRATPRQSGIVQPPLGADAPALVAARAAPPDADFATQSPNVPVPGTTGTPAPDRSLTRP
jgi:outer membrane protein